MTPEENTQVVQGAYAAFGRGDVAALLDSLAENVVWWLSKVEDVPYTGTRRGKEQVGEFFQLLAETNEYLQFQPREFIAQGDQVVVIGYEQFRNKHTGNTVDNDWAMVFTLQDGKIARFRSFEDTNALAEGYR